MEGNKVLRVDATSETVDLGGQKMAATNVPPQHGAPFLFHLRSVPFGFTKETFPTAFEGLLVDPNMSQVILANHECHDK